MYLSSEVVRPTAPPSYLVFAGLEPVVFTNIFPIWDSSEVIMDAMLKARDLISSTDLLQAISYTHYDNNDDDDCVFYIAPVI